MDNVLTALKGASSNAQFSRKLTNKGMKLRFKVDQAACFRQGINCDKSIVTVEVDPSTLPQEQRNLIADRLDGIDVLQLIGTEKGKEKAYTYVDVLDKVHNLYRQEAKPELIEATEPTFEGLMEAIRTNEKLIECGEDIKTEMAMRKSLQESAQTVRVFVKEEPQKPQKPIRVTVREK